MPGCVVFQKGDIGIGSPEDSSRADVVREL